MDAKRLRELFNHPALLADPELRTQFFTAGGAPRAYRPVVTLAVGGGADSDLMAGEFRAVVAVFDKPTRPDFFGDTITFMPGSFAAVLKAADEAHPIPVVFAHQWNTIPLGPLVEAAETKEGVQVRARLDMAGQSMRGDMARGVIDAMRDRTLREFSFGAMLDWDTAETEEQLDENGDAIEGFWGPALNHKIFNVSELFEVGPCLVGRHPDTRLITVNGGMPPRATTTQAQAPRGDEVAAVLERAQRLHSLGR